MCSPDSRGLAVWESLLIKKLSSFLNPQMSHKISNKLGSTMIVLAPRGTLKLFLETQLPIGTGSKVESHAHHAHGCRAQVWKQNIPLLLRGSRKPRCLRHLPWHPGSKTCQLLQDSKTHCFPHGNGLYPSQRTGPKP